MNVPRQSKEVRVVIVSPPSSAAATTPTAAAPTAAAEARTPAAAHAGPALRAAIAELKSLRPGLPCIE